MSLDEAEPGGGSGHGGPRRVGRYELRREIGRGTMGVVYEAWDPDLGRRIALKTIQLAFAVPPQVEHEFRERFMSEARAAARLSHPGIVVVHDVGRDQDSGAPYIAFEYLEGRTLGAVIKQEAPLPWRQALELGHRLALALEHAHEKGVVHRDMKPANVMLLPSGEPKIMDFGIAKIETARIRLTMSGQFFGTPLYMAPEQALGRGVDARSDVFSLGAILYSLLTGRVAFAAENIPRIVERVVRDDPDPPSRLVVDVPRAVDDVIARALAKDPGARYASAGALAQDVADALAGRAPRHVAPGTAGAASPPLSAAAQSELDELLACLSPSVTEEAWRTQESPLETLVDPPAPAADTVDETLASHGRSPRSQPAAAHAGAAHEHGARRLIGALAARRGLAAGAGLALAAAAVFLVVSRVTPPASAPPAAARDDGRRGPADGAEPAARPTTEEPAAPAARAEPAASPDRADERHAEMVLDFEHSLKIGTLRIWLDDELVVDEPLDARVTRKIAVIKLRRGGVEQTLAVAPGHRVIDVEVAWDDNRKRERIAGTFRPGTTRRLEVRLGRIRKNLSVEWR